MNVFQLSRDWFEFSFQNPDKIKPIHSAIYFFAIEHCNRLGWKEKFGFPSQMVMEAVGVKNWRTYSKGLNDLVEFGFIKMIEVSKNQYSSNIIAIVKNTKAYTKALDKALQKHSTKQGKSTVSIDIQETKNKEQEPLTPLQGEVEKKIGKKHSEILIKIEADQNHECFPMLCEWLEYKKQRKSTYNSEKGLKAIWKKFKEIDPVTLSELIEHSIEQNYQGIIWDKSKPHASKVASTINQIDSPELDNKELPPDLSKMYGNYTNWLISDCQYLLKSECKILSKDEFFDLKTDRTFSGRRTRITRSEYLALFKKAHNDLNEKGYLRNNHKTVFNYISFLIREEFKQLHA